MEEQLQVLFNEVKNHYSQDVLRNSPVDTKHELEMVDCEFKGPHINEPVIAINYELKYFDHVIGFTSEISKADVNARYNYAQKLYMVLHYDRLNEVEFELLDAELHVIDSKGEIVKIDSDITPEQIKQEMRDEMSLEYYVHIMAADAINRFEYDAQSINKHSFNHLRIVST